MNKRKRNSLIVLLVSMLLGCALFSGCSSDNLRIHFFKAGKADACLITKGNSVVMIDTGEESLSEELLNYFRNNGITRIDYLIITHFDKDHVGSAAAVIENLEVTNVLQSNVPKDSDYYRNYVKTLNNKGITPVTVSGNYEFVLSDIVFKVNGPEKIYEKNPSNNSSLITTFSYGDNSFIFMGDSENDRLKDYLLMDNEHYDLIKIPYHGHYQKQLGNVIETFKPSYAVITCSDEQKEDDKMRELLDSYAVVYWMTRLKEIDVYSDGKKVRVVQ